MTRATLLLGALLFGSAASATPPATKVVHATSTQVNQTTTHEAGTFNGSSYTKMTVKQNDTTTTTGTLGGKPFAKTVKTEPYANEIGGGGTRVTVNGHVDGVRFKSVTTRAAMPGSMGGGYGYKVDGVEPALP